MCCIWAVQVNFFSDYIFFLLFEPNIERRFLIYLLDKLKLKTNSQNIFSVVNENSMTFLYTLNIFFLEGGKNFLALSIQIVWKSRNINNKQIWSLVLVFGFSLSKEQNTKLDMILKVTYFRRIWFDQYLIQIYHEILHKKGVQTTLMPRK